jgi:hypothetical protein
VARAKQTNRAEARKRYRQATSPTDIDLEQDDAEDQPAAGVARAASKPAQRPTQAPSGRPSFLGSFRAAYHPAHIVEDLRLLPKILPSRAMLAGILLVLGGAGAFLAFPKMSGGAAAWDLLVVPASALLPFLVVGFFAPRASYLLGFIVGLVQAGVYAILLPIWAQTYADLGFPVPAGFVDNARITGLSSGPFYGLLFASMAAWYRRFLALSSPRRVPAKGGQSGRGGKPAPSKRAASR